jgi:competence protein ComEC
MSLGAVAGFVAGVTLVQQFPVLPAGWLCMLFAAAGLVCRLIHRPVTAAFLLGVLWATAYAMLRLEHTMPGGTQRQDAVIEGKVLSIPTVIDRGLRFDFGVERVIEARNGKLPGTIRLNWYRTTELPKAGETWRLRVKVRPPRGMLNPGGFDYEQWLFAEGIGALGYVQESGPHFRLAAANRYASSTTVWRQALFDRIGAALANSPVKGLIEALTLGVDDNITRSQWEVLRRTGTVHLIAISGSHIGLIAGFAFLVIQNSCAWLGIVRLPPPRVAAAGAALTALFYSALADFAIPTQRAMIMVAIAMGGIALHRQLDPTHLLAVAMLAVVAYDPLAVLSPGFWLSFGAIALIAFAIAGRSGMASGWRSLIAVNWATALGLAPLLFLFFGRVSLVSPLANLVAVPVLGTVLIPVCLFGALLLPLLPTAGAIVLGGAEWVLTNFWPALEWLAELPSAEWTRAEPPLWTVPLALLGATLLLAPRGIPGRWLGTVLLLPVLTWPPDRPDLGSFRLTLLDVGQGLASVVETRNRVLVFDTGAWLSPRFDMGSAIVEPYLRYRGARRIDALVLSHGDNDHMGGARSLLQAFKVDATYTSAPDRLPEFPSVVCLTGQRWTWDGVEFEMLGPGQVNEQENDNSCVLRVAGPSGSALLTADIERTAEYQLVRRFGERLRSDIVVVPHHGSNTSSTREFLAAVQPKIALIPAGFLNRFGFPHPTVLARYRQLNAAVLNSGDAGAITALVGNETGGISLESYRVKHRRYWNN